MSIRKSPLTFALIVICVLVWLAEIYDASLLEKLALIPALGASEPWRWVSSAFTHDDTAPLHIGSNMLALWMVGNGLETLLGRRRYLSLYLLSAFGGSVAFVLVSFPPTDANPFGTNWDVALVGASGAVFGLFGALVVVQRQLKQSTAQLWIVVGINVVLTFTLPGIAWQAHIGGFVVGAAVMWLVVRQLVKAREIQATQLRAQVAQLQQQYPGMPVQIPVSSIPPLAARTWPIEVGCLVVLVVAVVVKYAMI